MLLELGTPVGGGEVMIQGAGNGYSLESTVNAQLKGSNLSLTADEWQITAAPELQIIAENGYATYKGDIAVTVARVEIDTLPTSLPKPSRDVQVIGRTQNQNEPERVQGNVNVVTRPRRDRVFRWT